MKAVVVDHAGNGPEVVGLGAKPLPTDHAISSPEDYHGRVVDSLRLLGREVVPRRRFVVGAVSAREVTLKRMNFDNVDAGQVGELARWEADRWLPFDLDDAVLAHHVGKEDADTRRTSVLMVGARRKAIATRVSLMSEAGLDPRLMDTVPTALQNAVEHSHRSATKGGSAVIDTGHGGTVANLVWEGDVIASESIRVTVADALDDPRSAAEGIVDSFDRLRASVEEDGGSAAVGRAFLAGGGAHIVDFVAEIGECMDTEAQVVSPFARTMIAPQAQADFDPAEAGPVFAVAFGLALRTPG